MYKSSSNTRFINNMDNLPKFDFLLATSKSMRKKELKVEVKDDIEKKLTVQWIRTKLRKV